MHVVADGDTQALQLLAVGRDLKQGGDLGVAGQFRVVHLVAAIRHPHDEVGETDHPPVEEGGLEQHVSTVVQRPFGGGRRLCHRVQRPSAQ